MPSLIAPVLTDGGVRLRPHVANDAAGIVAQCQDPEMIRWTTVPVPYGSADAEWFLAHVVERWADGSMAAFAIEVDDQFAGSLDLRFDGGSWAAIGYGLSAWARGRGVMTSAVRLVLDWGFDNVGLAGVQWRAVVGNHASRRVAEKCGFAVEGTVRGLLLHRGERLDGWIGTLRKDDPR